MSQIIDLSVEKDHIESLTRSNGITALSELIWNSLDADSTEIHIEYKKNTIGRYESITIFDNGHGLPYSRVSNVFGKLGGSEKKTQQTSPGGRSYHGKEGKGRYKSLALGDLVIFTSTTRKNGAYETFQAKIDLNNVSHTEISDLKQLPKGDSIQGFKVEIFNVNQKNAEQALSQKTRLEYQEKFASYYISYPTFKLFFNDHVLKFDSLIKNSDTKEFLYDKSGLTYRFKVRVIEWRFDNVKKTYWCNTKGIPYLEVPIGIRASLPISIFIESVYIEELQRKGQLQLGEFDEVLNQAFKDAKIFAKEYVRKQLAAYSKSFIDDLKNKNLYPYSGAPENKIEEAKRQVFDIVALQVHDYLPSFEEQDDKNKKFMMSLLKETLETDSQNLNKILAEVIELPLDKREELAEILESTSLSSIIDTMTEIKNRLHFLNGLEQIIYNEDASKGVKERAHLHKIIVKETWIFGDNYTYGVDDVSLKNVLNAYLRDCLNRDDFEEIVNDGDNDLLNKIPDVCLWQQYSLGNAGKENLVIELKKPVVDAGLKEYTQILDYASRVSNDPRFPKSKTKWKFLLLTRRVKAELEPQLNQKNRAYGHVSEGDNFDVYVLPWGHVITEAKIRHEFIKDKLNLNFEDSEHGLSYIKDKYAQYLPAIVDNAPSEILKSNDN